MKGGAGKIGPGKVRAGKIAPLEHRSGKIAARTVLGGAGKERRGILRPGRPTYRGRRNRKADDRNRYTRSHEVLDISSPTQSWVTRLRGPSAWHRDGRRPLRDASRPRICGAGRRD